MGTGPASPKPHPRHAWLPAFLPAGAQRFRIDDPELARGLATFGADFPDRLSEVEVEISRAPGELTGAAACALVRIDRGEVDAIGGRTRRHVRRSLDSVNVRAQIREARRILEAKGYDEIHVGTWERPHDPYLTLPAGRDCPRSLASLLSRHAVVAGYRHPRPPTYIEAAATAAAAHGDVSSLDCALVAGSGILVLVGPSTVLRVGVGPAAGLVRAEAAALDALYRASPPRVVAQRVPRLLGQNAHGLGAWSLETRADGSRTAPPYHPRFLDDCADFLATLATLEHLSSAQLGIRDDAAVLAPWCSEAHAEGLTSLAEDVEAVLAGIPLGFGHGDFAAGNLLGDERLSGVVDWAKGGPGRLTLLDLLHLRLNIEAARRRVHLGEAIVDFLLPWARSGGDALLTRYCKNSGVTLTGEELEAAAVAYWLDFMASELGSYADRGERPLWIQKNVVHVANHLLADRTNKRADASTAETRIAVVVPCFNDGSTITHTVASVRAQEPVELVVVDDGSDDARTLDVLAGLKAEGVEVMRQENRGPAAARMAGVRATSAPYVFAIDADDAVASRALTALADALDADPEVVMAWGDTRMFGDASAHLPKARTLDAWEITYVNAIPTAALVRREALLAVGGWQLELGYEDWDLWMAFAERGWRGVHLNRTVAHHRVQTSRRWARDFARHTQIEDELRRRHERLFDARRRNWLRSRAPLRSRLLMPIVFALPLMPRVLRFRLAVLIRNPLAVLRLWLQARRTRARSSRC